MGQRVREVPSTENSNHVVLITRSTFQAPALHFSSHFSCRIARANGHIIINTLKIKVRHTSKKRVNYSEAIHTCLPAQLLLYLILTYNICKHAFVCWLIFLYIYHAATETRAGTISIAFKRKVLLFFYVYMI